MLHQDRRDRKCLQVKGAKGARRNEESEGNKVNYQSAKTRRNHSARGPAHVHTQLAAAEREPNGRRRRMDFFAQFYIGELNPE